jgi:hypothetical protein
MLLNNIFILATKVNKLNEIAATSKAKGQNRH